MLGYCIILLIFIAFSNAAHVVYVLQDGYDVDSEEAPVYPKSYYRKTHYPAYLYKNPIIYQKYQKPDSYKKENNYDTDNGNYNKPSNYEYGKKEQYKKPGYDYEKKEEYKQPGYDHEKKEEYKQPRYDNEKKEEYKQPRYDNEKKEEYKQPGYDNEKKEEYKQPGYEDNYEKPSYYEKKEDKYYYEKSNDGYDNRGYGDNEGYNDKGYGDDEGYKGRGYGDNEGYDNNNRYEDDGYNEKRYGDDNYGRNERHNRYNKYGSSSDNDEYNYKMHNYFIPNYGFPPYYGSYMNYRQPYYLPPIYYYSTAATTTTTSTTEIPSTEKTSEIPTTEETSEIPTTEETSEIPTTEETTEIPTTEATTETDQTSKSDKTSENPTTEGSTEPPTSEGSTETPTSEGSTETPTSEGSTETPTSEGSTEPPTSEGSTEPPTSEGSTEPPTSEGSTETPTSEGSTEPPTSEGSTETTTSDATTGSFTKKPPPCPPEWTFFEAGNCCIKISSPEQTPLTWNEASEEAKKNGARMASIHFKKEDDFIRDIVVNQTKGEGKENPVYFIGLQVNGTNGTVESSAWSDKTRVNYGNPKDIKPNTDPYGPKTSFNGDKAFVGISKDPSGNASWGLYDENQKGGYIWKIDLSGRKSGPATNKPEGGSRNNNGLPDGFTCTTGCSPSSIKLTPQNGQPSPVDEGPQESSGCQTTVLSCKTNKAISAIAFGDKGSVQAKDGDKTKVRAKIVCAREESTKKVGWLRNVANNNPKLFFFVNEARCEQQSS